jgi:hypothetical protein
MNRHSHYTHPAITFLAFVRAENDQSHDQMRNFFIDRALLSVGRMFDPAATLLVQGQDRSEQRPLRYHFYKQDQRAFRPFLTHRAKIACTFILGLVFIGLGIALLMLFTVSHEYEFRYDDVCPVSPERCAFNITIGEDLDGTIVLQYKLTNFHQNHRRFIYSRIPAQYAGQYVDWDGLLPARPYRSINDSRNESDWILPSGAFASFAFNDTFV